MIQRRIIEGVPAYILHPIIDIDTLRQIGSRKCATCLYLSLILVNDDKKRHHTSIGTMDHITAMLAMRDECDPTEIISTEFIERYLKLMTITPVPNEVNCYETVLNHPFIRFIQGRCYDAELSQFPYPFGSMCSTSGMCATSLSDLGVSVSCRSHQRMLDVHARSGAGFVS